VQSYDGWAAARHVLCIRKEVLRCSRIVRCLPGLLSSKPGDALRVPSGTWRQPILRALSIQQRDQATACSVKRADLQQLPISDTTGRLRGDARRNCVRRLGRNAEAGGLSAGTIERRLDLIACADLPPFSKIPASGAEHYAAGVLSTR